MDKTTRKAFITASLFSILIPLALIASKHPQLRATGEYLLWFGIFMAASISRFLAVEARRNMQTYKDVERSSDRAEDIIWVSVEDEHGNPLPPEEVERRLAEIRAANDPMDRVVPRPRKN